MIDTEGGYMTNYGDTHTRVFNKKGKEVNTLCCSPTLYHIPKIDEYLEHDDSDRFKA